jgi:probable F420-dependent oxidoreductase
MRLGAKVPNSGPLIESRGLAAMARELESAGFDSLWVSDHVVMPRTVDSLYPFASDGRVSWELDTPYLDALVSLTAIATATQSALLGTAVLVAPLRHPIVLAKQAASIDVLSGGRLMLGLGAGWLAEEFEALNVPFSTRGERLEEWITILRACFTGAPEPLEGVHYRLETAVHCLPRPAHEIPLLVGGHSAVALARAGMTGDGWVAHQSLPGLDLEELQLGIDRLRRAGARRGSDHAAPWVTLRLIEASGRETAVAEQLPRLEELGVDEIIVDVDWSDPSSPRRTAETLRTAAIR